MSQPRKDAISAMSMPRNTKEMQSFLGVALFFHHHIPNYSEWAAPLNAMTHDSFVWDPGKWETDYLAHFNAFKEAIGNAAELFFPDYSKEWVIRTDASQFAIGAVLFQLDVQADGTVVHQPIGFASKRFSVPAQNWDTYKREAYGIFYAVQSLRLLLERKRVFSGNRPSQFAMDRKFTIRNLDSRTFFALSSGLSGKRLFCRRSGEGIIQSSIIVHLECLMKSPQIQVQRLCQMSCHS